MLSLVATHPVRTLLPASFVLSFFSLSLTPSFISLILLLTSLLLYTRDPSLYQTPFSRKLFYLWLTLTASLSVSNSQPSIHALSTPSTSIASLILLSASSSLIALVPIILRHSAPVSGSGVHIFVFPALWSMTWLGVSWLSPIGRLATWSPLLGIESYQWMRRFSGFSGIDWVAAAWASVAAEVFENFIYFNQAHLPLVDIDHHTVPNPTKNVPNHVAPLTGLLLALIVPSFVINPLPLPPFSPSTTPLGVACILPERSQNPQLARFLKETNIYSSVAKILLWPEGAVTFETPAEKQDALEKATEITKERNVWIGVSFQERVSGGGSQRDGLYRNGMALVSRDGIKTYYKRRLVPIAESFSQISSNESPTIHTIDLPKPNDISKETWGQSRPISLSASICLDFSIPLTSLSSRPALILAPGRTWHVDVGRAMYELARARGDELGAEVLWCDGGAGGLSGVAGNVQVGTGSWVKTIGIPYPQAAEERRTVYGICGDWLVLVVLVGVPGVVWVIRRNRRDVPLFVEWRSRGEHLIARIRGAVERPSLPPPRQDESLLDAPVPST